MQLKNVTTQSRKL